MKKFWDFVLQSAFPYDIIKAKEVKYMQDKPESLIVSRFAQAIESSGLTFIELEKITGIAKSSLQRYASGKTVKIPMNCITPVARATGVSPEWIMGWDVPKSIEDHEVPADIVELVTLLAQAPEVIRKAAIAAATAVLKSGIK